MHGDAVLKIGEFGVERVPGAIVVRGGGATAAFTQRSAVVDGALGGTNLSATVGDDPDSVRAARRWAGALVGVAGDELTFGYQTHGAGVATVVDTSAAVGVAPSPLAETDALVTGRAGLGVGVLVADCVPTLLVASRWSPPGPAGRSRGGVGVVHSGWRGLLAGVLGKAAEALANLDADAHVTAFVGPAIGVCCYEVSDDVADRFARRWPRTVVSIHGADRPHVDLRLAAVLALAEAGVDDSFPLGSCTRCDPTMWSHRRGEPGRQALVAAVEP